MGVKGLKKLVEGSNTLEDVRFQNRQVVIDGPNLYYSLYFNSKPKLDQQRGGDYPAFRAQVRSFFTNLQRCNISALVVLDGGAEPVKGETVGSRLQDKLQKAQRISESRAGPGDNILPPLVKDVFIQVLQEMQVEVQQCFGEADLTAALCANERRCPVLSNDLDFYIFDVQGGFLPIDAFRWEDVSGGAVAARRYAVSEFSRSFSIDQNHLPVFAAVSGNDYSRLEDGGEFSRRWGRPGGSPADRQRAILRFLERFRGRSSEEAVREALRLVGKTAEDDVRQFLESTQKYALRNPADPSLPEWILREVRRGRLTSFVTSVVLYKSMMLTPLVEDFSQPSSYEASSRIRRFFYGLLVGEQPCREYDRDGTAAVRPTMRPTMRPTEVNPLLPAVEDADLQKLKLEHLNEAPEDLRRNVLYEALRCSSSDTENVPDHLKLPVCVTRFWFQYRQQNHPGGLNISCLQALLLGFVYGEADSGPQFQVKIDGLRPGNRGLQPGVAHAFSQWQNLLRQNLHLNQLLGLPLPEPPCSRLYCGPLLHRLQEVLLGNPETFSQLENLLDGRWREVLVTLMRITGPPSAGAGTSGGAEGWETQRRKKRRSLREPRCSPGVGPHSSSFL